MKNLQTKIVFDKLPFQNDKSSPFLSTFAAGSTLQKNCFGRGSDFWIVLHFLVAGQNLRS